MRKYCVLAVGACLLAALACSTPESTTSGAKAASSGASQPQATPSTSGTPAEPPMPANVVTAESGKTYAVGDAVKDPQNGIVIRVTAVRFDSTSSALSAGRKWAFIDLTLANPGAAMISVRPIGDLGVRHEGDTRFATEPIIASQDLRDKGMSPMENTDVPPGHAVARMLAVIVPVDAKKPTLWYAPGLIIGSSPEQQAVTIALGS